jgi:hypothetical protein
MPLTIKIAGKPGSFWTVGSGAPTASANAGDLYFRTDTDDVYQSSGGTTWTVIGNIKGSQGPTQVSATSGPILPWLENNVRRLFIQYASGAATIDSAGDIILSPNDTQSLRVAADGRVYFGATTDSPACNIYRVAASVLKTDAGLYVTGGVSAAGGGLISYPGAGYYGVQVQRPSETYQRLAVTEYGTLLMGGGVAAPETNLYRAGAGAIKTDGQLIAAQNIYTLHNTAAQSGFGGCGPTGQAGLQIYDTNLYRIAAAVLKTDGALQVGGTLTATGAIAGATNVLPAGGASGQVLAKSSATDYAAAWVTPGLTAVAITAATTPAAGNYYYASAASGSYAFALPTGQANGALIAIQKADTSGNLITVTYTSGSIIDGSATSTNFSLNTNGQFAELVYDSSANAWRIARANRVAGAGSSGQILTRSGTGFFDYSFSAPTFGPLAVSQTPSSLTAALNTYYLCSTTSAAVTITLPTTYTAGSEVGVKNIGTGYNLVTIAGNIEGVASAATYLAPGSAMILMADGATWRTMQDRPSTMDTPYVLVSGNWYDNRTSAIAALSNLTLPADTVYYVPIFLPRRISLAAIGLVVSTVGASSAIRLGAFTMDLTTGKPAAVIFDAGTVSGTVSGAVNVATSGAYLPAGWSFLACATTTGTAPQISYCAPGSTLTPFGAGTTQTTTLYPALSSASTGGVFAANPTASYTSSLPLIQFKSA